MEKSVLITAILGLVGQNHHQLHFSKAGFRGEDLVIVRINGGIDMLRSLI